MSVLQSEKFFRFYPTYILTNLLVCCCVLTSYQSFETLLSHLYTQPSSAVPGKTGKTVVLPRFFQENLELEVWAFIIPVTFY